MASSSNSSDVCFLIGRPRSGTTVFRSMLESHPQVAGMGEVFNEANPKSYFQFLRSRVATNPDAIFPGRSVENFRDYVGSCSEAVQQGRRSARVVVLDVKYDQAHLLCEPWWGIGFLPRIFSLIREEGWRVIDIHRSDLFAMYVSNLAAIDTKIYHSTDPGADRVTRNKIHLDPDALSRHLTMTTQAYRRIANHFADYERYCRVTYEEMFDPSSDGKFDAQLLERLAAFLAVGNTFDNTPKLSRLLAGDPLGYVENADEIRDVLRRPRL